ncbi:unnamed protein product [Polarella glacialis]|uniref:Uncharacterized protein n=1 Tax=Polarella glacialis TaxID=89957 RepID=A0A813LAN9_POLGL|nr:unnamed protein product [Polarella glacialis]
MRSGAMQSRPSLAARSPGNRSNVAFADEATQNNRVFAASAASSDARRGWRPPLSALRPGQKSGEGWDWCMQRDRGLLPDLAPPPVPPAAEGEWMGKTLTSKSTLTEEGQKEATRVLGALKHRTNPMEALLSRELSQPRLALESTGPKNALPQTCNQIYGARYKEASFCLLLLLMLLMLLLLSVLDPLLCKKGRERERENNGSSRWLC